MSLICLASISLMITVSNSQHPKQCIPTKIDWDQIMTNPESVPKTIIDFTFNRDTLDFDFRIELEYIGSSTSRTTFKELGTNYIIDFVSFKTTDSVHEPNNCANRITSSYINRDWNEWWQYSTSPWINQHIGTDKYLSYPTPSKHWTLSYIDMNYNNDANTYQNDSIFMCGAVLYHGHFTLSELIHCSDKNGISVINIEEDDINYYLSGALYVSIISPIAQNLKNLYKVYSVDVQSFKIEIQKSIHVVATISKFAS